MELALDLERSGIEFELDCMWGISGFAYNSSQ
jgi:hypothetical protein